MVFQYFIRVSTHNRSKSEIKKIRTNLLRLIITVIFRNMYIAKRPVDSKRCTKKAHLCTFEL